MDERQVATGQAVAAVAAALPEAARAELDAAMKRLHGGGGLLVRMADLVGGAMGRSMRLGARSLGVPPAMEAKFRGVAGVALRRAFDVSVVGLAVEPAQGAAGARRMTRTVVMLSGAVGGFLGMGGFVPDLTVTTLAILRSIARVAREEGEDLAQEEARQACLQVFALAPGGGATAESDLGYFSARLMLQGRPMVLLIGEVAARYGVSLSQKFVLQAVPVVGALSGAALNAAFLRHYQDVARAHFVVRRLERAFGAEAVREAGGVAAG